MILEIQRTTIDDIVKAFAEALIPPPDMTISEWSDEKRILPEMSAEPGKWRTSRFPYTKEIMDELSPQSPRQEVVIMGGAQVSKTDTAAVNQILYSIDYAPCPMLYVLPTIETTEKFSKQRLKPAIEAVPTVHKKVVETKHKFRDSDSNTILVKTFPGGALILAGANSAPSLRQMAIKRLIFDETDAYPTDLQDEGDPIEIGKRRTATYHDRKICYISTPTLAETSRIEPLFESGDQRYYNVPCPFCSSFFIIEWDFIKWENEDSKTAYLKCPQCSAKINEHHKTFMLANGFWKPKFPGREIASFHISSLYSPLGFYSWKDAVDLFLKYKKTYNKDFLKVFVNTVLGETWTETGKVVEASWLATHKEKYNFEVPEGVVILTAGVDVQGDRVEIEVVGWGRHEESWSIDYHVITGDTVNESTWTLVDVILSKTYRNAYGDDIPIAVVAIDSGFRAKVVYEVCKKNRHRRWFPVKGEDGFGKGYIRTPKRPNDDGAFLFLAFVDELKSKVYSQLKVEHPGPGYCHFPDRDIYNEEYFRMLTSEALIPKKIDGKNHLRWHLRKGRRNEALDCRVYSFVALQMTGQDLNTLADALKGRTLVLNSNKVVTSQKGGARVLSHGVQ